MTEIELRFHAPAEALPKLRRWVEAQNKAERTPLAAQYFDGPERPLARAGIGLRLRLEGDRWVQTVKGPAEDGMTRLEHNAALPHGVEPLLDLSRHAGHPLGERLRLLAPQQLTARYRTDILRTHRPLRAPGALLELCLDEGRLLAAERGELAVHDLELELLSGSPMALLRRAHALVAQWPISLDLRSKAERGENLCQGRRQSPPRKAKPLVLKPSMHPGEALRALLLNAFEQVGANASQMGSGDSAPEHLHQLRVGLRRLRSGLRLFQDLWPELAHPALPAFEQQAVDWFRSLSALRDEDVLAGPLSDALQAALAQVRPGLAPPARRPGAGPEAAARCVRQTSAQQFLIEWLGWLDRLRQDPVLAPPSNVTAPTLREGLLGRLRKWQRQLQRECRRFEQLSSPERHRLRKRIKRLRYGLEFAAGLDKGARLARCANALKRAQEQLGELLDVELALARCQAQQGNESLFELGWLAARREALLPRCEKRLRKLADEPRLPQR